MIYTYLSIAIFLLTGCVSIVFTICLRIYIKRFNSALNSAMQAITVTNLQLGCELVTTREFIQELIARYEPKEPDNPDNEVACNEPEPELVTQEVNTIHIRDVLPLQDIPWAVVVDPDNFLIGQSLSNHQCAQPKCSECATHYLQLLLYMNGFAEPDVVITLGVGLCLKHIDVPAEQVAQRCWRDLATMGISRLDPDKVKVRAKMIGDDDWVELLKERAAGECGGRA